MPVNFTMNLPTGVQATYHVVTGGGYGLTSLTTSVNSYLSQTAYAAGDSPLVTTNIDVSFVLPMTAPAPATNATIGAMVINIVENALISQQTSNPLSTTANPLPPINGVFYGGTIVS